MGSTFGIGFAEFVVCSGAVEGISVLTESGRVGVEDAGAGVLPWGGGGDLHDYVIDERIHFRLIAAVLRHSEHVSQ